MGEKKLFKINEFASIFGTTVKTLRFYEKVGLFMPFFIDQNNGYRYYSFKQTGLLSEIVQLKEVGFSLSQIKKLLNPDTKVEEKFESVLSQREKINQLLLKIDRLKSESTNIYCIDAPDICVYPVTKVFHDELELNEVYKQICSFLIDNKLKLKVPCVSILTFESHKFSLYDFKATLSVCVEQCDNPIIEKIPKGKYFCMIYKGEICDIEKAYEVFFSYFIKDNLPLPKIVHEFYEVSCIPTNFSNPYIIELRARIEEPVLT